MTYNSVEEIYTAIDATRERIYMRAEELDDERAAYRSSEGAWSALEILEHLAMIEEGLTKMMEAMIAKVASAVPKGDGERVAMEPFSLDEYAAQAAGRKFEAPEIARPKGGQPRAELVQRLRRSREALRRLQPSIETADFSKVRYPHPAFGPLNIYQWLAFIGLHEGRHLRQMEAQLSSAQSG